MDELQRSSWLLSTPVAAEMNRNMQEFTGVKYQTNDQYKSLSLIRIQKDPQDAQKMFEFLGERDPFDIYRVLINLNSGEVANESVNIFQAQAMGESLIHDMAGTSAFDYKFRKKDMVITINTNASFSPEVKGRGLSSVVFFQRLIAIIRPEEIIDPSSYELCTRPSSLLTRKI